MLASLPQRSLPLVGWRKARLLLPFCLVSLGVFFLHGYVASATTAFLIGWIAIVATTAKRPVRKVHRFAFPAATMLALTWLVPVSTLLYFSIGLLLFYWLELQGLRVHFLGPVILALSSPAFLYATTVFSFPLRMQLTTATGAVFSLFASNVQFSGNTIFYDGREFAVDPACAGLHMLSVSLLLGLALLGLLEKKAEKSVGNLTASLFSLCLFGLNLLANVLRIVLLVQFAVPATSVLHDAIGLLCLLLYVCVPACLLARRFVLKAKTGTELCNPKQPSMTFPWLLMILLGLVAQRVKTADTYEKFNGKYAQAVTGFASSVYAPGIVKLENEKALVYVKFIRGFYDTEHNPGMCWKGSGYAFAEVKKKAFAGRPVHAATLCKGSERLYTAWWYANSRNVTASQWDWRWNMLKGEEAYAVVNVTAATETALAEEVEKIMLRQSLHPLLHED